ncbi:hypothetical protein JTB14_001466 [Gonioctena quinquepunctata]|nr:hypothetical protein JTB14_001466 [Gonioctena quinquepunctata]
MPPIMCNCTPRRNFPPTRIHILKISSKSDTYALDTPGRKLDPEARESVLSGICSLPRADLLEVLNTLFLSLGDDIARIPALNNFVIAKVEEKVQQNTINEPSGKRVKKEQFPSLPPTKGNPLQSSITVQRKRSCRSVGVQDVESCRTYNVDVSNKFESIANVDDTDMRMDENYSPGADPSLQCMPGPSHEEIQIPNQKLRESKIINNNDEQMDNNEDQRYMQEARKQQVPPITVRDKSQEASEILPYTTQQYSILIRASKKNGPPYIVHELTYEAFFHLETLQEDWGNNFTVDTDNNQVKWHDIKVLRGEKGHSHSFFYKVYKQVNVRNVRKRSAAKFKDNLKLVHAYSQRIPLSE